MSRRRRPLVVLLHDSVAPGAPPDELDTLAQAAAVEAALDRLGYDSLRLALSRDFGAASTQLQRLAPHCVFNLVESLGSDGRLIHAAPTLLEALGLDYTGSDSAALVTTSDKIVAKRIMASAGVATPPWLDPDALGGAPDAPEGPFIVKSRWEDASIGLGPDSIVPDAAAASRRIAQRRARFGGDWFAECYIEGREFNVALLAGPQGPEVLPMAEMRFVDFPPDKPRIVDYTAKWQEDSFEYRNTRRCFDLPPSDRPLVDLLARLARACWPLFGLGGYARIDFRVDAEGRAWVLEVNANPCLAPDAGFAAAAERAGLDLDAVVARILADRQMPSRVGSASQVLAPQGVAV